jgi:hypothetical protein
MRQTCGADERVRRMRGGSRLNFLLTMAILIVGGYCAYQFVPVYYTASQLETFMQDTVNKAAVTNKTPAWVEQQLRANAEYYSLPPDALIESNVRSDRLEAHIMYVLPIPLFVTTYQYKFDYTAKSSTTMTGG